MAAVAVNAPELAHVGIIPNNDGPLRLSIACDGADDNNSSSIDILIHSLVDLGEYVDPNNGREGHLFRLNGSELKILRWGDAEDAFPEISYQKDDFIIHHLFDTANLGVNPSYDALVAHFQEHLVPEEEDPQAGGGGKRRKQTKRRRRSNYRRRTGKAGSRM